MSVADAGAALHGGVRLQVTERARAFAGAAERSAWSAAPQLVVSARLDTDGTAATRGPEDLVGRGAAPRDDAAPGGWGEASVQLVGRGIGGRLVTQRN